MIYKIINWALSIILGLTFLAFVVVFYMGINGLTDLKQLIDISPVHVAGMIFSTLIVIYLALKFIVYFSNNIGDPDTLFERKGKNGESEVTLLGFILPLVFVVAIIMRVLITTINEFVPDIQLASNLKLGITFVFLIGLPIYIYKVRTNK